MPYLYTPAQYAQARQRLDEYGAAAGRDSTMLAMPMYQFIYVAASDDEAQDILARRLQQTYQQPFARLVTKYCTAGTPATCRASLQSYIAAGVREFILTPPVASPQEFRQQLDFYAAEIFPALRAPG
jgi:alkanesulfonate monooxygenase SsuD/methylene tetrahydromethanopterin reductase-like flavin-dependent oxidoreductase (luciferase family)